MQTGDKLSRSVDISERITRVLQHRLQTATERFRERVQKAAQDIQPAAAAWWAWPQYASTSRSARCSSGTRCASAATTSSSTSGRACRRCCTSTTRSVLDGRTLERPVNYALLRIVPPEGVTVDAKRRPYVIIDPRAGHGPGIGGFKDDSQVGVALRAGHPVYFVIFFRDPEPGQTLLDVCDGGARVRAQRARAASGQRRSRRSSATARAAGRR